MPQKLKNLFTNNQEHHFNNSDLYYNGARIFQLFLHNLGACSQGGSGHVHDQSAREVPEAAFRGSLQSGHCGAGGACEGGGGSHC